MTTAEQTLPSKCLACDAHLESPIVCTGCRTLFPVPEEMDYFELFRLPKRYDVDAAVLERKFLAISRTIHPDYFGAASPELRDLAVRLSAELNEAARVLSDPVLRAGYLLERMGGKSAAEERTVPQAVLQEVMMLREDIEEAGGDAEPLGEIRERVRVRRGEILQRIAELAENLPDSGDEEKAELRRQINSVKYYDNLLNELPLG